MMRLFASGSDALASALLSGCRPSDLYGEPAATPHELEVVTSLLTLLLAADPRKRPTQVLLSKCTR